MKEKQRYEQEMATYVPLVSEEETSSDESDESDEDPDEYNDDF